MVFNLNLNYWYECLAPRERGAFDLVHSYYVLSIYDVPDVVYDGLWVTRGGTVGSDRYSAWFRMLNLRRVVIPNPDGPDAVVYRLNPADWVGVTAALLEPTPASWPCYVRPPWTQ